MVKEFFWHNPQKEKSRRRYLLSSAHCQKILTKKQQFSFLITKNLKTFLKFQYANCYDSVRVNAVEKTKVSLSCKQELKIY